jgi:glycosyltransferase involved in cell wall biosynthesis
MKNILIIGFVWPEPNSSAAGSRMLQLIEAFLSEGAKITFASTASDSDFMFDVQQLGINKVSIELNNSNFDTFVRELNPEIVLFDRFMIEEQFGWRVAKECPNALRILDTEDLHCLRSARQLAVKEKREFNTTDLFSDTSKREVASIFRSDITLIISTFEMKILTENFKVDPSLLLHFPFFLDPISELTITNCKSFEERIDFAFIGNFLHEPNWDAVKYLKEEIWPLIKKELPDSKINIYGAYPSQKVNQLHNEKEGFLIKGRAQSASEVIENARVTIVPLRFGAGIKGKLVESMQCGTPSITTSIGAESMHGNLPWSGFIENETSEIAKKSIELYTSKSTWLEAQKKGINIINSIYSKKDNSSLFLSNVKQIQQNIEQHRINNFTGAMLMHHTLASTKYMSKWIEEKNLKMS